MPESNIQEIVVLTVTSEYYSENIEVFSNPNVKIKSVHVEGENHKNDLKHKILLKSYLNAQTELRDYEFNKRHNK